jgi:Arc/MetJ-type ribon-helix-helix transcriptional regulator
MEPMKKTVSATIDKDLIEWIEKQVDTGKYRNKSHVIEYAIRELRQKGN